MPNVSLSNSSPRRFGVRLLLLCLAIAVSYLFSILPFGNARVGFMPPVPVVAEQAVPSVSAATPLAHGLSDALTWDGDCQIVWAAVNDVTPLSGAWALLGALPQMLTPAVSGIRPTWARRLPARFLLQRYRMRAPPRTA